MMSDMPLTPEDVVTYYGTNAEAERLAHGAGALEFERTTEIVLRFLSQRAVVADVGGAGGQYAEWLVQRGHAVELVDPVPLHIETARARAGDPPRFGVHAADARELPFGNESFDAVLLLGPLYHLGERGDRVEALAEAGRVCRRGGFVFAAAISRFGPLLDAIRTGRIIDRHVFANVQAEVLTGRRVPPERRTTSFPDAYFHLPDEVESEAASAGLDVRGVYGVEGPGWLLDDLDARWQDEEAKQRILSVARAFESDRNIITASAHLLAVARKPE